MKVIINILGLLFPVIMYAQNTLNTVGGSVSMSNATFEWSIGETTVITTNTSANIHVTHGLLQPIKTVMISCITSSTPLNREIDVPVDTNIEWIAIDNALGYYVSIGTTSGGTDIVNNELVTGTSYSLTNHFPKGITIYMSIVPFNSVGNATGCSEIIFTTEKLYNETKYGISPNGDGINDFWIIGNIEKYPENIVSIYNRWGDLIFQTKGYNNQSKVFNGRANKLNSIGGGELPSGTYFFLIENIPRNHQLKKRQGFLVLKR